MPRSRHNWHQFFADYEGDPARRRGRDTEAHADRSELVDDVVAWITAYLDPATAEDERAPRHSRRGSARRFDLGSLFEDGTDPSAWPEEVHEHLAALRDRLHGISARQSGRRRGERSRGGRRRETAGDRDTETRSRISGRPRRLAWAIATRLAVLVITAMVARRRSERSRRRRGFSV